MTEHEAVAGATPTVNSDPVGDRAAAFAKAFSELATAFAKAQGEFATPKKTKTATIRSESGASYTYHYSTLDDLIAATRPALAKHGLSVLQNVRTQGAQVTVTTTVFHASGQQWTSDPLTLRAAGDAPQKIGSAITYARRYSMSTALGVAAEDDDDAPQAAAPQARPRPAAASGDVSAADDGMVGPRESKPAKPATEAAIRRMLRTAKEHSVSEKSLKAFLALAEPPITKFRDVPADRIDGIIGAIRQGIVDDVDKKGGD